MKNKCIKCGEPASIKSWGEYYCKECLPETSGHGHSGMIYHEEPQLPLIPYTEDISVFRTKKSDEYFVYMFMNHYPDSKGIVGRCLCYYVIKEQRVIGIIGGASPPINYKKFNNYFNDVDEKHFLNNNVFRLIDHTRNYGTMTLSRFRRQVKKDYERRYEDELIGLVTFVEPPRTGAVYKADNWDYLGMTQGKSKTRRGSDWSEAKWSESEKKHIFGYKY